MCAVCVSCKLWNTCQPSTIVAGQAETGDNDRFHFTPAPFLRVAAVTRQGGNHTAKPVTTKWVCAGLVLECVFGNMVSVATVLHTLTS